MQLEYERFEIIAFQRKLAILVASWSLGHIEWMSFGENRSVSIYGKKFIIQCQDIACAYNQDKYYE